MKRSPIWKRLDEFLLCSLLLFLGSHTSQALEIVLADNLSESFDGYVGVSNTQWVAQAFTTNSAGFELNSVSLRLFNNSGTTGTFELQIWNSVEPGGRPGEKVGSAIYSGLAEGLSSTAPGLLTVTGLEMTLATNTTYYIVAIGVSLTDVDIAGDLYPGSLGWSSTPSNDGTGFPAAKWDSTDSGLNWIGPFTGYNYGMRVTAVPEPSTWALAGLGVLALGWSRRAAIFKAAA